jgi:uncharacterized membrane protein YphA (DoxX/SURF4 family)
MSGQMPSLGTSIGRWAADVVRAWDRFWFTPQEPHTLALVRLLGGAMLLYSHAVWTLDLDAFLGPQSWLTPQTVQLLNQGPDGRSYTPSFWFWIHSPYLVWSVHLAALAIFALLTVGLFTRVVSVLAAICALAYCHRLTGCLFGLDQINTFMALYLMVGDSGAVWSLDAWRRRRSGLAAEAGEVPRVSTNLAMRLLQVHLCVLYLFGGIGKMRGETWWDGSALWFAFASLEYQSLDMTWTVRHRWALALLTHLTVFWETFYCFFVWPRLTRPICLALAVLVHGGIALCLGMKTFGLAMIIANMVFIPPEVIRGWLAPLSRLVPHVERSGRAAALRMSRAAPAMSQELAAACRMRS